MIGKVKLQDLRLDGDTQSRVAIDDGVVEEYAESMKASAKFPPVIAFDDGQSKWLADGFHRYHSYVKAGIDEIDAEIKKGSKRDAKLFAVGANVAHGLRRSNEDKRKAVTVLLTDAEWKRWSDAEIAKRSGVSDRFVSKLRKELSPNGSEIERMVERNGTVYAMSTKNIGNAKTPAPSDTSPVPKSASIPCCEADQNIDTVAVVDIESNNPNEIQREEIIDLTKPEREVAKDFDQNAGSWKERLLGFPWASVNGEPLPTKIGFAVMITMEEVPGSINLLAILEVARNAQYGLFATIDVQQHLVNTTTKELCLLDNKVVAAPTVEKAPRRKRLPRFAPYEQPF